MGTKKIVGLIISVLLVGAFAFCLSWTIINWDKVQKGMSGTGLYTQEDLNKSYEDGYKTALDNKQEYETLINTYRDVITELNDVVSQLNSQMATLTKSNRDYELTITSLQNQKIILQNTIDELTKTNNDNQLLMASLNIQVNSLSASISTMTEQTSKNADIVSLLNSRVAALENSIAYYEQLLNSYESNEKATVTFMFNGAVHNMQVVAKNTKVAVTSPISTTYLEFNGWSINGFDSVNIATYPITQNTIFVALVTHKYDVKFIYETTDLANQIVAKNNYAAVNTPANTTYKEFKGWSIDGSTIVDISNYPITANTTFVALLTYKNSVKFMSETVMVASQVIVESKKIIPPVDPTKNGFVFQGWSLTENGSLIDVNSFSVTQNITLYAVFKTAEPTVVAEKTVDSINQTLTATGAFDYFEVSFTLDSEELYQFAYFESGGKRYFDVDADTYDGSIQLNISSQKTDEWYLPYTDYAVETLKIVARYYSDKTECYLNDVLVFSDIITGFTLSNSYTLRGSIDVPLTMKFVLA